MDNLQLNEYIKQTIESGIEPLELRFFPIVSCDEGLPIAYRTKMAIHSVILGEMEEEGYTYVSDNRDCGVELFKRQILHAIKSYKDFYKAKRNINYISIRCPSELVEKVELYKVVGDILNEYQWFDRDKLCLEFPASLLEKDFEKAKISILDMKLLKIKTAIVGCGDKDFKVSKLVDIQADYAILAPSFTAWAGSRDKPQLLASFVSYIKSMGIDVIAEGTEENRKEMRGSDCTGFICVDTNSLSLQEAVAQREEEE